MRDCAILCEMCCILRLNGFIRLKMLLSMIIQLIIMYIILYTVFIYNALWPSMKIFQKTLYIQFSNKSFLHVYAGCEGYRHSLHPQRHPLHWRNPSSFPALLTAGLQATQRQPCGDNRLVSIDHTACRSTELNLEFQHSWFSRSFFFFTCIYNMTFLS